MNRYPLPAADDGRHLLTEARSPGLLLRTHFPVETARADVPLPVEARSISLELSELAIAGMDARFSVLDCARLRCSACRTAVQASACEIGEFRRLEGSSDPSEMAAVVGIQHCPRCSVSGAVVLSYGPRASDEDQDVMTALLVDDWRLHGSTRQ